ncbi:MAG: ABC transporter ATP-binding protein [Myxococcales bacterium]|nr:ABC transporter ATP-binding protein [Myxococcales bacterium]
MPLLDVKALAKTYYEVGAPLPVLQDLELTVEAGEMVGIVGDSGAGKSTLLYILGALERPSGGEVWFDGKPVFHPAPSDPALAEFRNREVGFVFQFHGLIPEFDTLENAMMPAMIAGLSRREAGERARQILTDVGLAERLHHKPGELSGGEQQRVAFARSLVMRPRLILADEPTGNLDTATGEKIWDLMFEVNKQRGTTFIVVTHNERLAARLPRLRRLANGRLENPE